MFVKGKSGNPGGRKKGTPNKNTVEIKTALEKAFDGIGGVEAFTAWAKGNRELFYPIWVKLLPKDVNLNANVSGRMVLIFPEEKKSDGASS